MYEGILEEKGPYENDQINLRISKVEIIFDIVPPISVKPCNETKHKQTSNQGEADPHLMSYLLLFHCGMPTPVDIYRNDPFPEELSRTALIDSRNSDMICCQDDGDNSNYNPTTTAVPSNNVSDSDRRCESADLNEFLSTDGAAQLIERLQSRGWKLGVTLRFRSPLYRPPLQFPTYLDISAGSERCQTSTTNELFDLKPKDKISSVSTFRVSYLVSACEAHDGRRVCPVWFGTPAIAAKDVIENEKRLCQDVITPLLSIGSLEAPQSCLDISEPQTSNCIHQSHKTDKLSVPSWITALEANQLHTMDFRIGHLSQLDSIIEIVRRMESKLILSVNDSVHPSSTESDSTIGPLTPMECTPITECEYHDNAAIVTPSNNNVNTRKSVCLSIKEVLRNAHLIWDGLPSIPLVSNVYIKRPVVVCYLFVPSKGRQFHVDGLFNWTKTCIFIPLFPQVSLWLQICSLSVVPDVILFKLSNYLAEPHTKFNLRVLTELYNICSCHRSQLVNCVGSKKGVISRRQSDNPNEIAVSSPCAPLTVLTTFKAQKLMLDRHYFLVHLEKVCSMIADTNLIRVVRHVCLSEAPTRDEITTTLECAKLQFPLLCKARLGGGLKYAHELATIYSIDGLRDYADHIRKKQKSEYAKTEDHSSSTNLLSGPTYTTTSASLNLESLMLPVPTDIIVQEFVPHDDIVYKVFVLGEHIHVTCHQSLPNPSESTDFEAFCGKMRKATTTTPVTPTVPTNISDLCFNNRDTDAHRHNNSDNGRTFINFSSIDLKENTNIYPYANCCQLDLLLVKRFCSLCTETFQTELFGLDILLTPPGIHVVIDINFFPSYNGFPHLKRRFDDLVTTRASQNLLS